MCSTHPEEKFKIFSATAGHFAVSVSLKTSGLNINKHHLKPNGLYKLACLMSDCFYSFYGSFAQSFIFVLAQKLWSLNVDNAKLLPSEVII